MPANSKALRTAVARAGAAKRWRPDNEGPPRDLAAERIAQYVERILSDAPALTDDQRDRIAGLLRGGPR